MQRVKRPRPFPGAKVRLPALLVQICEDEEQQHRDEARDEDRRNDNTAHRVGRDTSGPTCRLSFGGKQFINAFTPRHRKQQVLSTWPAFRCPSESSGWLPNR